jgi:hypothetical protein
MEGWLLHTKAIKKFIRAWSRKFEIFTAVRMTMFFWVLAPCRLIDAFASTYKTYTAPNPRRTNHGLEKPPFWVTTLLSVLQPFFLSYNPPFWVTTLLSELQPFFPSRNFHCSVIFLFASHLHLEQRWVAEAREEEDARCPCNTESDELLVIHCSINSTNTASGICAQIKILHLWSISFTFSINAIQWQCQKGWQ